MNRIEKSGKFSAEFPTEHFGTIEEPLYNSRVIKNYSEYLEKSCPEIGIDPILAFAGITRYELEDQAHWFTQKQVDRFQKILSQKTGDPNLSRKVGRFSASSEHPVPFGNTYWGS